MVWTLQTQVWSEHLKLKYGLNTHLKLKYQGVHSLYHLLTQAWKQQSPRRERGLSQQQVSSNVQQTSRAGKRAKSEAGQQQRATDELCEQRHVALNRAQVCKVYTQDVRQDSSKRHGHVRWTVMSDVLVLISSTRHDHVRWTVMSDVLVLISSTRHGHVRWTVMSDVLVLISFDRHGHVRCARAGLLQKTRSCQMYTCSPGILVLSL